MSELNERKLIAAMREALAWIIRAEGMEGMDTAERLTRIDALIRLADQYLTENPE